MGRLIQAADLFCGAGGTSTGLLMAAEALGLKVDLTAINHWEVAVATHAKNHPGARHLCESIEHIDPRKVISGGRLHLLWASPECIHHSIARGGVPCSDQSRATAWHIVRWASSIYIDNVIVENVPEFMSWGPLGVDGRPMKSMKGKTFLAFKNAMESLGYRCEGRILNCANYGDATKRLRFFMICRRGRRRLEWPMDTHSQFGGENLFGSTLPWVPARDIIDWAIPGESIFARKKPLSENTLARIEAGLRRYGGEEFLVRYNGSHQGKSDGDGRVYDSDDPIGTLDTSNRYGLCSPFMIPFFGERSTQAPRTHSIDDPMPAVTSHGAGALLMPFILPQQAGWPGELRTKSIDEPLSSITTTGAEALVMPAFLYPNNHAGDDRTYDISKPMPTLTTKANMYLSFLVKYYGTGKTQPITEPLDTVTTKDRFALIEAYRRDGYADILFRMFQPHELAAAHSFPGDYHFEGTKSDIIKQIGNSVPRRTAQALCDVVLRDEVMRRAA